ncbi:MAG: hypothetical protein UHU21_06200, partial [Lachnospiraceae bacterium]|nr:hypothetical protein [Lachnospiraceae bacterium]
AENSAPFVHHYFGGALPLREKRSGYYAFCCAELAKSKYRRFSRPTSTAMHKKASSKSGRAEL